MGLMKQHTVLIREKMDYIIKTLVVFVFRTCPKYINLKKYYSWRLNDYNYLYPFQCDITKLSLIVFFIGKIPLDDLQWDELPIID